MRLGTTLLSELAPADGLQIDALPATGVSPGWSPEVVDGHERFAGADLGAFVQRLAAEGHLGAGAEATLTRALARLDRGGGRLDLTGERFVLLGAGAEIAPTLALLQAGATVLWCDVHPAPAVFTSTGGRLLHARGKGDLLRAPERVAQAVGAFVRDGGPIHLGMFAYAPGKGREWRLGAAMNAVVRSLPPEGLRSVGLYVSPTSPAAPETPDEARARARWRARPSIEGCVGGTLQRA